MEYRKEFVRRFIERRCLLPTYTKKHVDMLAMLAEEEDFKNQKIWLQELLEDAEMEVDFFPKVHGERVQLD